MRVLICDDSSFMRKAIAMLLDKEPDIQVVDTARNGEDALEKIRKLTPDVVTLDLEMPVLDGMGVLTRLRAEFPIHARPAILVCSTLTSKGSHEALKAMMLGAADVIFKDTAGIGGGGESIKQELLAKLRAIDESHSWRRKPRTEHATRPASTLHATGRLDLLKGAPAPLDGDRLVRDLNLRESDIKLVAIGSSTGGPPVLEHILSALPKDMNCPVVVAQHMPPLFTKSLAERLAQLCAVKVIHADAPMPLRAGCAYIIVGGKHGRISGVPGALRIDISERPTTALYRPSVDELLQSAADITKAHTLGVVLTGMGDDGARGGKSLFDTGAKTIAQDGESCVVYGMPRSLVQASAASASARPDAIAHAVAAISVSGTVRKDAAQVPWRTRSSRDAA
jgi:two-component system chemotaxis response regulator CheB